VLDGPGDLQFVVSGAGINADLDPGDLETDRPVATIRAAVGPVDPTAVAVAFHANLLERSAAVERETGVAALRDDWREHATTLGDLIRISRRAIPFVGRARDIGERGELLVETGEGTVAVTDGESERLRRA